MNQRAIITGASGFTGRAVINELTRKGWEVISIVRNSSDFENEYIIDFDSDCLFSELSKLPKSEVIIHLASHVDFSAEAKAKDFFATTILVTACLSQLAKVWSAKLIFASGTIIYGNVEYINSGTPVSPINEYGHSKLLAENIITSAGIDYTILRIPGIYGYKGPEHLHLNNAITLSIDNDIVPILKGTGVAKRNYIYVHDLASIIYACVLNNVQGTHLVSGKEVISIKAMLQDISDVFLNNKNIIEEPGNETKDMVVENSPNLIAEHSFREALVDIRKKHGR